MPEETEVLLTIFGMALCVGGWIIFHMGTRLIGLALGLGLGFAFGMLLAMALQIEESTASMIELGCALLGAFGGLLLMRAATTFTFGATGFLFGAMIGRLGSELWLQTQDLPFAFTQETVLAILASAAVVGLLAVWLKRMIVIVVTSFIGATFLAAGVPWLEAREPTSVLAVFVAAVVWQLFLGAKFTADRRRVQEQ